MEYKLLEQQDLELMKEILEDDDMEFNIDHLNKFLNDNNNYGFIAKDNNKVVGFAYGYNLTRPDGKNMFYIHSIGILPKYQNLGYGTKLLSYIIDYSSVLGCYKTFIITDKGNPRACHIYEKLGGINNYEDEVVYVYNHEK